MLWYTVSIFLLPGVAVLLYARRRELYGSFNDIDPNHGCFGVVSAGLGGLVGAMLQKDSNRTVSLLLRFDGAMLYVVSGEILPQANLMYHSRLPAFAAIVGMPAGLFIIFA